MGKRLLSSVALVVLTGLVVFGCGQEEKSESPKAEEPKVVSPEPQKEKTGVVIGKIVYKGIPPSARKLKINKDVAVCGTEQSPEDLVMNPENNGIRGAVITVKGLIKTSFASQEKILDQRGCRFEPHVLVIASGDKVNILNSDGVLHNIHSFPEKNPPFNESQPKFKKLITKQFNSAPDYIKIKCDVHSWMNGWIIVVPNPYYAVTNDSGEFRIDNIPIGRQILEVWHQTLGPAVMEVDVREDQETQVDTLEWSLMSIQPVDNKPVKKKGTIVAKPVYDLNCASCHGSAGRGDGPAAVSLPNKPANLTQGTTQKKYDTELENAIRNGRPEKGMPSWNYLPAKDIKNLVDYIRHLGGK